jgi:hypothetical protein
MTDEQADAKNAEQLERALADTKQFCDTQDGKDPLEAWGALPDTRPE